MTASEWVFLVSSERDVAALSEQGRASIALDDGFRVNVQTFRGAKVTIIVDNVESSRERALNVANALDAVVAKLLVYTVPLPYEDLAALLASGTLGDLVPFSWRANTPANQNGATPIRVVSVQELLATPETAEADKLLDCLIVRGHRLVIGAHSGQGKSTWCLQVLSAILRAGSFLSWQGHGNGTRALVLDAEQGRKTVKRRFIEAGLHELPDKVDLVHVPDGLALDADERHVAEIEAILKYGRYDVVLADPLYKLHRGNANDERKAVDLMRRFDYWRERFQFALILPMHCRKPQPGTKFSMHDLMGSSAYSFGAEVVCGLEMKSVGYSRLHWWKDREGDLGCLNEIWGLLYNREGAGFTRDPRDFEDMPIWRQVQEALEQAGDAGLTMEQLREMTGISKPTTVYNALERISASHDGARLKADRVYRVPERLFNDGGDT